MKLEELKILGDKVRFGPINKLADIVEIITDGSGRETFFG